MANLLDLREIYATWPMYCLSLLYKLILHILVGNRGTNQNLEQTEK